MRNPVQVVLRAENITKITKIDCQAKIEINPAPSKGARAGTIEKMIMTKEEILAISRPEYRSRIIAWETTRGAAAPKPWHRRAAIMVSRLLARIQMMDAEI
jgi:hypothetical protein